MEDLAESFDLGWLSPPQAGELFDNPDAAFRRFQGFVFSQGFAIVTRSTGAKRKPTEAYAEAHGKVRRRRLAICSRNKTPRFMYCTDF